MQNFCFHTQNKFFLPRQVTGCCLERFSQKSSGSSWQGLKAFILSKALLLYFCIVINLDYWQDVDYFKDNNLLLQEDLPDGQVSCHNLQKMKKMPVPFLKYYDQHFCVNLHPLLSTPTAICVFSSYRVLRENTNIKSSEKGGTPASEKNIGRLLFLLKLTNNEFVDS